MKIILYKNIFLYDIYEIKEYMKIILYNNFIPIFVDSLNLQVSI